MTMVPIQQPGKPRPPTQGRIAAILGVALIVLVTAAATASSFGPARSLSHTAYQNIKALLPSYRSGHGEWTTLKIPGHTQIDGIDATLLRTGNVLLIAGSGDNPAQAGTGSYKSFLLNPSKGTVKSIPTPWDAFGGGTVALPNGNVLVAGGTARYAVINPAHSGGSMTITNWDLNAPITLPRGTLFIAPGGQKVKTAFSITAPQAIGGLGSNGVFSATPGTATVWVNGVATGRASVVSQVEKYTVAGTLANYEQTLYGIGTPMTLQNQNYLGLTTAYIFDVAKSKYVKASPMIYARWLPALTETGQGAELAMSGLNDINDIAMRSETYGPGTGSWVAGSTHGFPGSPAVFQTSKNNELFFTGSTAGYGPTTSNWRAPGIWNTKTGSFKVVPGLKDPNDLETSTSVLLAPAQNQRYMVIGGGASGISPLSTTRTAIVSLASPHPRWTSGPNLLHPTRYAIAVDLPDDQLFITGGSQYYRGLNGSDNRDALLYNATASTVVQAAAPPTGRDQDSGGLLLPNGDVITFGGYTLAVSATGVQSQTFNHAISIYRPPYLFTGDKRPQILSAPSAANYGHTYLVHSSPASPVSYLRLIRPGSVSHGTDANARSVAVPFKRLAGGWLRVTIPSNPDLAPPGYYMLFGVSSQGVPSSAAWVKVS